MENDKKRGGIRKGAGRKPTGRERNKNISFRVTEKEKEEIYNALDKIGKTRTEALLKIIEEYENK